MLDKNQRVIEKLEILEGERGLESRPRRAVRIRDLQALLEISKDLTAARAAGATPTKAEFDALVADVQAIAARLAAVADALRRQLL